MLSENTSSEDNVTKQFHFLKHIHLTSKEEIACNAERIEHAIQIKELYGKIHDRKMMSLHVGHVKRSKSLARKKKKQLDKSQGLFGPRKKLSARNHRQETTGKKPPARNHRQETTGKKHSGVKTDIHNR
jgi:hypothetical protein